MWRNWWLPACNSKHRTPTHYFKPILRMITRKTLWTVVLAVCGFTALYLFYVHKERNASVTKYLPQPQLGDVYKMKARTSTDGAIVYYLKIKDIGKESIYFYPSRMQSGAAYDVLLNRFDTTETEVYTRKELAEIAAGQWNTVAKDHTQLIEIERKD